MSGRNGLVSSIRRLISAEERLRRTHSTSPFEQLRQQMSDVLGDQGILKEVIQPGDGPPVPENASVIAHYSGFLEYSDQPFETTTNLKYPPDDEVRKRCDAGRTGAGSDDHEERRVFSISPPA
ncbi:hypothetical protein CesoFtcFv8_023126 [Champsocephalus esox]|uniref:Uncharacterized protein n=1 Tax=Champsocephalus esox TaxID=159716 RepID=A0AAN8GJJ8_9TELE|nr:hypothetical protein CesoFtcFv8_023126 [Champsocephalus esox]